MSCVYALRFNKLLCNNQTIDRNIPKTIHKTSEECFKYDIGKLIGEGTFGQVFTAKHAKTLHRVAIKLIKCKSDKIELMAVTEIQLLKTLKHQNIIQFNEDVSVIERNGHKTRYLVLEYCDYDLCQLLCHPTLSFSLGEVKNILYQFFNGLSYIHQNRVIHRDIKPANILITKNGKLKIADFGLAKSLDDLHTNGFSTNVVTLAYRPPELLLKQRVYDTSVDMWSAGCIMAEMWTRTPIMLGFDECNQLMLISQLCGSLNSITRQLSNLNLTQMYPRRVKEMLLNGYINDLNAADLLDQLLCVNPNARISARRALNHMFFMTEPKMCDISHTLMNFNDHLNYYNNENNRSL